MEPHRTVIRTPVSKAPEIHVYETTFDKVFMLTAETAEMQS